MAYETSRYGDTISKNDWRLLKKIVNHVGKVWQKPDAGLWETRAKYKHFVYSKVMCWLAIDRGIKIAEKKNFTAPLAKWQNTRQLIYEAILKRGFSQNITALPKLLTPKNLMHQIC